MNRLSPYSLASLSLENKINNKKGGYLYPKKSKIQFDFIEEKNKINKEKIIFIGNRKDCILIRIPYNLDEAIIQYFRYNSIYTTDKHMERGLGTRKMMKTSLELLKNKYGIKKLC